MKKPGGAGPPEKPGLNKQTSYRFYVSNGKEADAGQLNLCQVS